MDNKNPQVCRLCLVEEEDLVYIFDPEGYGGFRLLEIIEELLQLEVYKEDGLPGTICEACVGKVKEFKEFKETSIRAKILLQTKIANMGFVIGTKEDVIPSEALSEEQVYSEKDPAKDESAGIDVSNFASDPLDLTGVKADVDEGESLLEAETRSPGHYTEIQSLDKGISNVVCLPIELGHVTKEEVYASASLSEGESYSRKNLFKDEYAGVGVSDVTSDPLDLIGVKEDADENESLFKADTQGAGNLSESQSLDAGIMNVVSVSLEIGDSVDDHYISGENPKTCGKKRDVRGARNEITLKRIPHPSLISQGLNSKNNSTMTSEIQQHQIKKKRSAKCRRRFKSGNDNKSTFKEYDPRYLGSQEKSSINCTEYVCDYCGMMYSDIKKLLAHIRGHDSNNKLSKCVTSGEMFLMRSALTTARNQGSSPFKCEKCEKEFKSKSNLSSHIIMHNGLRPFKCDTCGKTFTQKGHLRGHAMLHDDLKPFKCELCGKEFTQKSHLREHALIHSGLRPFKCEMCGKAFIRKSHLREHTIIHSGLRPFKCETCGKKFTQKSDLRKHAILHSGVKQFKCEVCGKEFAMMSYLKKHAVIHSGLRPFKCEICGKGYTQKGHLRTHAIIHKGLRPFKCGTC